MTDDPTPRPAPGGGFFLPQAMRAGWKPFEIVYARYTRDPGDPKAEVIALPGSYVICRTDIEAFVRGRLKNEPLPGYICRRRRDKKDPCTTPARSIDIYVGCASYVVIELDAALPWQFRKGHPGITTEIDQGESNGRLFHVMPDGRVLDEAGPDGDGCRVIYFEMNERDPYEHQKFICHIDFGKSLSDPIMVDPDIPNDGGKFPTFPRSPCLGTQTCSED